MTRTLNVVIAAILGIALTFAATGCSGSGKDPNPQSSWLQDDDLPDSTPVGKKAKPGLLDRLGKAVGGGAAGKLGGWMFWPIIILLLVGGILINKRIWGPGGTLASLGLIGAMLQWGIGFGFEWYTGLVVIWIIPWAVSLATRFKWDNYIIYLGSVPWLLLSAIGQAGAGLPGLTWGVFQALLVFAVAPALWRQPAIGARWLIMIPLWIVLLLAH